MLVGVVSRNYQATMEALGRDLPPNVRLIGATTGDALDQADEIEALIGGVWFPTECQAPKLRWIHLFNAGFEDLPDHTRASRQWQITHGGGPSAVAIAEWTLAAMLFFTHRFRDILRYEQERSWWTNRVADMTSSVLRGKTVGFLGYGAIARETARLCKAFGMQIQASLPQHGKAQLPTYRTPGTGDPEGNLPDVWFAREDLCRVLPEWDYIVLGLRVDDSTRHILCAETLRCARPTAIVINAARGALVEEQDLLEALRYGQIGGAALDVFETEPLPPDHPLRDAPNVLISPHCSPESAFFREEIMNCLRANLHRFAQGEPLLNVIQHQALAKPQTNKQQAKH
jgi:phosphoglycerate dehydrogenase-like enzyme